MTHTIRTTRTALLAATLAAGVFSIPQMSFAARAPQAQGDEVASKLDKKQFQNVKVHVDNGVAILTGTVDLFEYKADAEKRVRKAKGVTAVRDDIQVAGPNIPDSELKAKL